MDQKCFWKHPPVLDRVCSLQPRLWTQAIGPVLYWANNSNSRERAAFPPLVRPEITACGESQRFPCAHNLTFLERHNGFTVGNDFFYLSTIICQHVSIKQNVHRLYCIRTFSFKNCHLRCWLEFHKNHWIKFLLGIRTISSNFWNGSKHTSAILYYLFRQRGYLSIDNYKIQVSINPEKYWRCPAS